MSTKSIKSATLRYLLTAILLISAVSILFFIYQNNRELKERSVKMREDFLIASKQRLVQAVDDAIGFMTYAANQFHESGIRKPSAKPTTQSGMPSEEFALDQLTEFYFCKIKDGGAVFAIDFSGKVVTHPNEAMEGTNLAELKDILGGCPFANIIEKSRNQKSGFNEYKIYDEANDEFVKVLSRWRVFKPWDLIVCAETPLRKFEAIFDAGKAELRQDLIADTIYLSLITVAAFVITFLWYYRFSHRLQGQFNLLIDYLKKPLGKKEPIPQTEFDYEELRFIAESTLKMDRAIQQLNAELEKTLEKVKKTAINSEVDSQAKSCFFANISHEIRTRLNGLMGMADFLAETRLADDQRKFLGGIKGSCDSLLGLLGDINDYSTIETGRLMINEKPFDLIKTIENASETARDKAVDKGLTFNLNVADETPKGFVGDRERLEQVITTLLDNAIRFTKEGGVELNVAPVDQNEANGTAKIRFQIKDTGPGISKDKLDALFDFTHGDDNLSRKFGGVALGLTVCKHLVELMGGQISADSEKEAGTRVNITIPARLASEEEVAAAEKTARPPIDLKKTAVDLGAVPGDKPFTVLLAEDDPVNQSVAKTYLKRMGCDVDVAHNGQEAVSKFKRGRYDLILMDCEMPEMDGMTAVNVIRKIEGDAQPRTPIIALTANALKGDKTACLNVGMDGHLAKPINGPVIERLLKDYMT